MTDSSNSLMEQDRETKRFIIFRWWLKYSIKNAFWEVGFGRTKKLPEQVTEERIHVYSLYTVSYNRVLGSDLGLQPNRSVIRKPQAKDPFGVSSWSRYRSEPPISVRVRVWISV